MQKFCTLTGNYVSIETWSGHCFPVNRDDPDAGTECTPCYSQEDIKENGKPHWYAVYIRHAAGDLEWIDDYNLPAKAALVANTLATIFDLPVIDKMQVKPRKSTGE